jgi:hypothetical protein
MEKDENKQATINIIYHFPNIFIYLLAGFVCHVKQSTAPPVRQACMSKTSAN